MCLIRRLLCDYSELVSVDAGGQWRPTNVQSASTIWRPNLSNVPIFTSTTAPFRSRRIHLILFRRAGSLGRTQKLRRLPLQLLPRRIDYIFRSILLRLSNGEFGSSAMWSVLRKATIKLLIERITLVDDTDIPWNTGHRLIWQNCSITQSIDISYQVSNESSYSSTHIYYPISLDVTSRQ